MASEKGGHIEECKPGMGREEYKELGTISAKNVVSQAIAIQRNFFLRWSSRRMVLHQQQWQENLCLKILKLNSMNHHIQKE